MLVTSKLLALEARQGIISLPDNSYLSHNFTPDDFIKHLSEFVERLQEPKVQTGHNNQGAVGEFV